MFDQIQYEVRMNWCPIAAFLISFGVFLACLLRAWRAPEKEMGRLAGLPLEDAKTVEATREKQR